MNLEQISKEWLQHLKNTLLKDETFSWVGIYWMESFIHPQVQSTDLILGPYIGFDTPHTRISISKGVCGRAVRENQTLNIDDVNQSPDYLSCSIETKSEIVIPLRNSKGEPIGELDIDSKNYSSFSLDLQKKLEEECLKFEKQIQNIL